MNAADDHTNNQLTMALCLTVRTIKILFKTHVMETLTVVLQVIPSHFMGNFLTPYFWENFENSPHSDYIQRWEVDTMSRVPSHWGEIHSILLWKLHEKFKLLRNFNPIQDGAVQKALPPLPLASFSSVTSRNVEISPQKVLTFSFNLFATLVSNFKVISSVSPKLLNLNQEDPSKKNWSNPYKIEVMITSLIEMLDLPNSGHLTTSTV